MVKQIIISFVALASFCLSSLQAQTAAKLIEKYKAFPGAEYLNTTEESLKQRDSDLTPEENAKMKKNFKKSEQVQMQNLDEEQLAQIEQDIKALKGYELLFTVNKNTTYDEDKNILRNMLAEVMNPPSVKVRCYGKVKGKTVSDLLVRLEWLNTVALSHVDTKIDRDLMTKALMADGALVTEFDDDDDGEVVEMKDVLEEVKNGNVLFVIEGKEYPDLHSTKEASEYMMLHNIRHNTESWIIGSAVKEKYPNTDKKVVIEFSDYTKELQKYVDAGDVLFVIKDKEYPELRSIEAAKEFMKANNIKCFNQHWVSESEAKTKYPTVKRKAIIEYY